MIKSILFVLLFSGVAQANIICKVKTSMGSAIVDIGDNSVTISGAALPAPQVYSSPSQLWDGHATELITAPGLSISFQNWYGCIHNAEITANFRDSLPNGVGLIEHVHADQCTGGSTPDKLCHAQ